MSGQAKLAHQGRGLCVITPGSRVEQDERFAGMSKLKKVIGPGYGLTHLGQSIANSAATKQERAGINPALSLLIDAKQDYSFALNPA